MTAAPGKSSAPAHQLQRLHAAVGEAILGKDEVIQLAIITLLARGHILIDDIPGVGKTTLAQALARAITCSFRRIQFTSDLLPSDILGVKVYDRQTGDFKFLPGPIFHSIILADEINRTTPRSQSALLEAMSEHQVTIEGETFPLPEPFMVIATENPIEHHGAYPLPDSQLDRFMMSVGVGYPDQSHERQMLSRPTPRPECEGRTVMDAADVIRWQDRADQTKVAPEIVDYILDIIARTRAHQRLRLGASPRAALALRQAAKASALLHGRDYTLPDDVKKLAAPVIAHRLIVAGPGGPEDHRKAAREIIEEILDTVPVPV